MPVRLFVGNLSYETTESDLRELFSTVAPVSYLSLPKDRESGKLRGFAFVEYTNQSQADEAILRFNNQPFKGRRITVNVARERDSSPRSGAPPRPSFSRPPSSSAPTLAEPPRGDSRAPMSDAPVRRPRTKSKKSQEAERRPKGPMREIVKGQYLGSDNEASEDDFFGDNFASRVDDDDDDMENEDNS